MEFETAGHHEIQGIGAGFIQKNLDLAVVDEVLAVCFFTPAIFHCFVILSVYLNEFRQKK